MPKKKSLSGPVTKEYLGEYTEQVILPGVEAILEKRVGPLEKKIDEGFAEMRKGFAGIERSIQVLGGDIAELKEQKLDERVRVLERKAGVR